MGVGEVRAAEVAGERPFQGRRAELLPEVTVQAARLQTRGAIRIEADEELIAIDDRESRTRC